MKRALLILLISLTTLGCSRKTDFSNPEEVIKDYYTLLNDKKYEKAFDYIADTCKATLSIEEFKKQTSFASSYDIIIKDLKQIVVNNNFPRHKHYEVLEIEINKDKGDTLKRIVYKTLMNVTDKWKIIRTDHLFDAAQLIQESQKYDDAIKAYKDILNLDPYSGDVYNRIGWSYLSNDDNKHAEENAKTAIDCNPKDPENYNLLAAIYSAKDLREIAIEKLKKGAELCYSKNDKVMFYSNISLNYRLLKEYNDAKEYANWALSIDPEYTHALWQQAEILNEQKMYLDAIDYYKKALKSEPLSDYLQSMLYFNYAKTLYFYSLESKSNKSSYLKTAREYASKSLELSESNKYGINLLLKMIKSELNN